LFAVKVDAARKTEIIQRDIIKASRNDFFFHYFAKDASGP